MSEVAFLTKPHEEDHELIQDYHATEPTHSIHPFSSFNVQASNFSDVPDLGDDTGVYYINFTPEVTEKYRPALIDLQGDIADFRSWATWRTAKMIQRKIENKELDGNNVSAVSSYRAKAFNVIIGQQNDVLNIRQAANNYDKLEVKDTQFQANILRTALAGFTLNPTQIGKLESIIDSIVQSLKQSQSRHLVGRSYFILALTYTFDSYTQLINCSFRTIAFSSTEETHDVAKNCSKSRYVRVEVSFSGNDFDFNRRTWTERWAQLKDQVNKDKGGMADDPDTDVPV